MSDGHAFASIFPTIIAQNVNIAGARFLATDDVNGPACCRSNASPDTWRYIMGCSKPLSHYTPLFCIFAPWSNVLYVCVCVHVPIYMYCREYIHDGNVLQKTTTQANRMAMHNNISTRFLPERLRGKM